MKILKMIWERIGFRGNSSSAGRSNTCDVGLCGEVATSRLGGLMFCDQHLKEMQMTRPCVCGNRGYTALINNEHFDKCPARPLNSV